MLWRGLTRSCAVCGERGLTRRFIILTPTCPRCGFRFERSPGHFVGAVGMNTMFTFGLLLVTLLIGVALTFPDAQFGSAREPGLVSGWLSSDVGPGEAVEIDCGEVPSEFFPGVPFPPYIQGFLVIESTSPLDVTAVYTTASVNAVGEMEVRSIDVETVPERRLP